MTRLTWRPQEFDADPRWVWGLLAALTVAAGLLRFPFISTQSLWFDETFTHAVTARHSLTGIWDQIRSTESTPPLYYLAAKLTGDITGSNGPFALRFPSALALTAAVPVSYRAFRGFIGRPGALATAAFVAVNPTLVNYSTDGRCYGLLVLTGLLSIWAFATVLRAPSVTTAALWVLAAAACIWTHYFGAFTVLAEVVVLVLAAGVPRMLLCGAVAVLVLLTAGLLPLIIHQGSSGDSSFITAMSLSSRVEDSVRQFAMGANVPRAWLEALGLLATYLALVAGLLLTRARRGTQVLVILAAGTVGLPLLLAVVHLGDRFYMRNVMIGIPLLGALAAPALLRRRGAGLAVVIALATVTSVWVASDWRYLQADWRTAVASDPSATPSTTVLTYGAYSAPVAALYLHRRQSTSAVTVTHLTLIIAPYRGAHDRALEPQPEPGALTAALSGCNSTHGSTVRGFQIASLTCAQPRTLSPGQLGGASLFGR